MKKKLLAAGSVLAMSLLLASCAPGEEANTDEVKPSSSSSSTSEPGVATGEPTTETGDSSPTGDQEAIKTAILKVQKDVEVDAESNIAGTLADSLAKVEAKFPDEKPFLSEFIKSLNIKLDESSLSVDSATGQATVNGTTTPGDTPYPAVANFVYQDGSWKLTDILIDDNGQQTTLSSGLEQLAGVSAG